MNKTISRYGLLASLIIVGLFILTLSIGGVEMDYQLSETLGYLSMLLAMSMVFFGIKAYRDQENGGVISFGKAFQVGSLIALFPSTAFGIYTIFFFMAYGERWVAFAMENMTAEQRAQFEGNPGLFMNPFFQAGVMFLTVLVIGLLIALISSWILKRNE